MNLIRKRPSRGWYSHFKIEGKLITRKSPFKTEKKSQKWARDLKKHLLNERADPNYIEPIRFKSLVEKYLISKRRIENPHLETKWLLENFGNPIVSEISKQYIHSRVITELIRRGVVNETVNRKLNQLQAILNWGYDNGYSLRPWKIKKLPTVKSDKAKPLNLFEKRKLFNCLPEHLKDPFIFACIIPLRKANLRNLKQENIRDGKIFIKGYYTKQKRDYEHAINDSLQTLIDRNIAIDPSNEYIFKGFNNRGYLGDFKKAWENAKKRAGIDVRWHDLRHTGATDMYKLTKDIFKVMKLLGHTTTRMAERYVEADKTQQESDINKLSEGMSEVCPSFQKEMK